MYMQYIHCTCVGCAWLCMYVCRSHVISIIHLVINHGSIHLPKRNWTSIRAAMLSTNLLRATVPPSKPWCNLWTSRHWRFTGAHLQFHQCKMVLLLFSSLLDAGEHLLLGFVGFLLLVLVFHPEVTWSTWPGCWFGARIWKTESNVETISTRMTN